MAPVPLKDRTSRSVLIAAGVSRLLFASVLVTPAASPAAGLPIGTISITHGQVTVMQPGSGKTRAVVPGSGFSVGDLLGTRADSTARAELTDGSFMNLAPGSTVRVSHYKFDADRNRRFALITVLSGTVRFVVHRPRASGSVFRVESGSARVDAGPWADFTVAVSSGSTEVIALDHTVSIRNVSNVVVGEVSAGVNQRSVVKDSVPPSKPGSISPAERKRYLIDIRR